MVGQSTEPNQALHLTRAASWLFGVQRLTGAPAGELGRYGRRVVAAHPAALALPSGFQAARRPDSSSPSGAREGGPGQGRK